jgi:hypothetical protein
MSDAAAKAKARRAKILARENKQVSAVNVEVIKISDVLMSFSSIKCTKMIQCLSL